LFKGRNYISRLKGWWTNNRAEGIIVPFNWKGKELAPRIYNDSEPIMTRVLVKDLLEKCIIF